jgi:UDP-glucose 4-epimerase
MAILVTGGAGYVGSHTVRHLRQEGRAVVVLDNLEKGHRPALLGAPLVVGDIMDAELVRRTIAEYSVDAVIHFAGYKAAGESVSMPGKYFDNNVARTAILLRTLAEEGVGRFVFSSSCAVYGASDVLPVDENQATLPESPYGTSKLMVEQMLDWFDRGGLFRSVSLRYFNAAGASFDAVIGEDSQDTTNLIPVIMNVALGGLGALRVFGSDYPTADGTAVRDYVHVVDLAVAHLRALEYLEQSGATTALNLGTGTGSSVLEVVEATRKASGANLAVDFAPRRAGDPAALYASTEHTTDVLGWTARFDLAAIVDSAWRWHSTHPDGYRTPQH